MPKKLDRYEFIWKAIQIHGYKYDYSKVNYINAMSKVCIICPIHGEFWQSPNNHINMKQGCPKCANNVKLTTEEFIEKAKIIHGNRYDYSKVNYINAMSKVCIICSEHGEFWQKPSVHLQGHGCIKCVGLETMNNETFIEKAKVIHEDKYDYSKVKYINASTPICIICPEHGEFWQTPKGHLNGNGCAKCYGHIKLTTEQFIERAKKVHGDRYNYSKVNYINNKAKVCIICPVHGEFWQLPKNHLKGYNCPLCAATYNTNELKLYELLKENYPSIIYQYRNKEILKQMSYDFFIPEYKIAIEYQGRQHFVPIERFDGEEGFDYTIKRDKTKYELSLQNNINLLYFTYDKRDIPSDYMSKIITDEEELINKIKNIIENYGTMGTNNI